MVWVESLAVVWLLAASSAAPGVPQQPAPRQHQDAEQGGQKVDAPPQSRPSAESSRLPSNLARLHQQLRDAEARPSGGGITLNFTVHVVEQAPRLNLFTPKDNLRYGQPRFYPPIHQEMMRVVSPVWVRH